jgi:hypothetical protein
MFKSENESVAQRAEKRYEAIAKQNISASSKRDDSITLEIGCDEVLGFNHESLAPQTSTHMIPHTRYPTPESMARVVVSSIDDQALNFFLGNFVAQPIIVPRGQYEWIAELLVQPDTENTFRRSLRAASMAAFAVATKIPGIMRQAQAAYGSALRSTNEALSDKESAIKNSTLISIILLGLYENFVFPDRGSINVWAKHVDGACTLLNLRGQEQFQSSIGRRVFHQFYGTILQAALETGRAVHPGIHELYQILNPNSDYRLHGRQWTARIVDILHGTVDLNRENQDKQADPRTLVEMALTIDRELDELKKVMPRIWKCEVIRLEHPTEDFPGEWYHIALDPWIAQMWNNIASARLSLYNVVRENLARGWTQFSPTIFSQSEYENTKAMAEQAVRYTAASVVASVPQITGMIPFPDLVTAQRRASNPDHDESSPSYTMRPPGTFLKPSQPTQIVNIIWPLYAASQPDLIRPETRQWSIDMLHFVALRIGSRQAVVLAEELKEIQRNGQPTTSSVDNAILSSSCSLIQPSEFHQV